MKLKLDENLGGEVAELFRRAGHDAATVAEERLCGAPDVSLIEECRSEERCLVTLDLDFGNPLLFRPREYSGIAILRLPARVTWADIEAAATTLIAALARDEIQGRLWIVQRGRVRQYQPLDDPIF